MRATLTPIFLAAALTGCSTSAFFVTKTSLSILDADTSPASVSIAYDRVEGFIGPLNDDGTVPPVIAKIQTDGKVFNSRVKQIYATGDAATALTGALQGSTSTPLTQAASTDNTNPKLTRVFFGTSTTTGLKVGFSDNGVPNAFLLGYKRKELSTIPNLHKAGGHYVYPQLLAAIDTQAKVAAQNGTAGVGLGVCQSFATGAAAVALAGQRQSGGDASLSCGDASIADLFGDYHESTERQKEASASVLSCYVGVQTSARKAIWEDAARHGLLSSADDAAKAAEENRQILQMLLAIENNAGADSNAQAKADRLYASVLLANISGELQNNKLVGSSTRERLLEIHKDEVCRLSKLNQ